MSEDGIPEDSGVDYERLTELWAKVEVANIMMKQANKILEDAATDLKFYNMIVDYKDK